jgi:uncharacterized repeat protein (TIGR03803 family)
MRSKKPFSAGNPTFVISIALLLAAAIVPAAAQARKFKVLHTFQGAPDDGAIPEAQLLLDGAGNIYGTTGGAGSANCPENHSIYGCGTAFKLDKNGKRVWLHSFNLGDGLSPMAGLMRDKAGNLYGTTVAGGDTTCNLYGCGTVYKLDKTGKETVLHKFHGSPDGESPEALLVEDAEGNLYGTTLEGGDFGYGTVFKLDRTGRETVFHSFGGSGDGKLPYASVIRDTAGNLYGVTAGGGPFAAGTVYELDQTGKETVLYNFRGGSDGGFPVSVLLSDRAGNLYGTTQDGGNGECGGTGCGVVFELSPQSGENWTERVLYVFCSLSNCADGQAPLAGPLVRDVEGNLYGTTYFGGASHNCNGVGCGTVFKLDSSGNETVLHSFANGADGGFPWAGLVMDNAGRLYGMAEFGGDAKCIFEKVGGCGVVFKITP